MKNNHLKFFKFLYHPANSLKRIYLWFTATRRRKILSATLAVLILLTSIRFIFFKPTPVSASDVFIKFDEGYGTTDAVNDTNSNISPGSITNAVWKTEDMCFDGKCLYFDGDGDYVSFTDSDSLDMAAADEVTINLWFRTGDITSGTRTLVSKYETTGGDGGYRIYMNSDGKIIFGIDSDNSGFPLYSVTSVNAYDDNRWHFVSAVKDGTSSMSIYIDAMHQGTTAITSTNASNDDTFYIGVDNALANGWLGFIDEVKVMRSARTQTEVKTDFAGQTPSQGTAASFGPDNSWISNGLVGYWKMDESSDVASDSSGLNNHLTNNNTTTFVGGKFGNGSEHVPASEQYFSTTNTISGIRSVSFWTNPDALTNYYVSLSDSAYITSNSSGVLSATGFTNPKIYVNGVTSTTVTQDQWQLVTVTSDTAIDADQFYVGRVGDDYFDGTIDEVRLYNRALSPAEVQQLYNWAPGPVGWWSFDEGSGLSAYDKSGNGNTGTLTNMDASSDWVSGKFGKALDFDGTDDYVISSSNLGLSGNNSFTVSLWSNVGDTGTDDWWNHIAVGLGSHLDTSDQSFNVAIVKGVVQLQSYGRNDLGGYVPGTDFNGEWMHVTATYDGSNVKLFINGILKDTTAWTTADLVDAVLNISGVRGVGEKPYKGVLDDVKIYNYARTPQQIVEDMNAGHPAPGSPVGSAIGHWKFDEG